MTLSEQVSLNYINFILWVLCTSERMWSYGVTGFGKKKKENKTLKYSYWTSYLMVLDNFGDW